MSQAEEIYLEIHNYCIANANDALVKKYSSPGCWMVSKGGMEE